MSEKTSLGNQDGDEVIRVMTHILSQTNSATKILEVANWLLHTLKLDELQKNNVVKITSESLQNIFNDHNELLISLNHNIWTLLLWKGKNWRTQKINFNLKANKVIQSRSELLDSSEDIVKDSELNDMIESDRQKSTKSSVIPNDIYYSWE